MKFCTIGCGGHAFHSHGPSQQLYAKLHSGVELSACCDLNLKLAETYRSTYGFERCYANINEMLEKENPDALALIVPPAVTCSVAAPLLELGIPLLLEKPPGLTLQDCKTLITASEKGGGMHMVAFNRRYAPVILKARQWLDSDFSDRDVFCIRYDMVRHSRTEPDFSTTAIHAVDAALFLARSPYQEMNISCRELPHCGKQVSVYLISGKCENGTEISIAIQPVSGMNEEKISIYAQDRNIHIDLMGKNSSFDGEAIYNHAGEKKDYFKVSDEEFVKRIGIYGETETFLNAVRSRVEKVSPELKDCLQQASIMEAIRTRKEKVTFTKELSSTMASSN